MIDDLSRYGVRLARVLIAIVFLLNALGVIDQTRAAHEMIARGMPASLTPFAMWSGRALELAAGLALTFGFQQRLAALALAAFMVPATLVAHPFWLYYGTADLQVQLVNCYKNIAIIGGLLFIASTVVAHANHKDSRARAAGA